MTETGGSMDQRPADDCYALDILTALSSAPERVAVHWRGRAVQAGELAGRVADSVRNLRKLGIGPGSTVAVLVAPNSPDMLTVRYATHLLGGAVTYVRGTNPASTARELAPDEQLRILLDSSTQVLVADAENIGRARELSARAPGRFVVAEADAEPAAGVTAAAGVIPDLGELPPRDPRRLALISYTSGSTGKPKGICLSAGVVEARVRGLPADPDARLLAATPLSFVAGQIADAVLHAGGTVVLHEDFDAVQVVRAIAEHSITLTFMATPQLYQALEAVQAERTDLTSLRALIYTGVAASPTKLEEATRVFGPTLVQLYGSSESAGATILLPGDHDDPRLRSTAGRPFPGIGLKICDEVSGAELPVGEPGEVWLRSANLMDGYLNDPALTARTLRDGWYLTGDIGRLDEQGYLSLVDRVADTVKTDGVKVHPAVVEREIANLPGVANVAVYGVRDLENLEHVHAAVVVKPGAQLSPGDIRARISEVLSPVHAPEEIHFLDELPLGFSGKADKHLLRRLYPIG